MPQPDNSSRFRQQVANSFSAASAHYMQGARLQQQVGLDALAKLPKVKQAKVAQGHLLDLGCGPGWLHPRFTEYCRAFTAVDFSAGMLAQAAKAGLARQYLQADAQQLPLANNSFDSVFSSLMLQWCSNPSAVFAEVNRVLKPGGTAVITTLVDGTLTELAQAFASLDNYPHISRFLTVDSIQQAANAAPALNWQFELRRYPLYYPDVQSLARELKLLGANQVAGRRTGLTGKGYWQQLAQAYEVHRTVPGLPASYQVLTLSGAKHAG